MRLKHFLILVICLSCCVLADTITLLHVRSIFAFAATGNVKRVAQLLAQGANINAESEYHHSTPLVIATTAGQTPMVEFLLDHGAKMDAHDHLQRDLLTIAIMEGHLETARLLLKRGALNLVRDDQDSPLVLAVDRGQYAILRMLLEQGCDPNRKVANGKSALETANELNDPESIEILKSVHSKTKKQQEP